MSPNRREHGICIKTFLVVSNINSTSQKKSRHSSPGNVGEWCKGFASSSLLACAVLSQCGKEQEVTQQRCPSLFWRVGLLSRFFFSLPSTAVHLVYDTEHDRLDPRRCSSPSPRSAAVVHAPMSAITHLTHGGRGGSGNHFDQKCTRK